jgi:hypothetical protein
MPNLLNPPERGEFIEFPLFLDYLSHSTHVMIAPEGVSSFGFGGTNGRCDIWGAARWVG